MEGATLAALGPLGLTPISSRYRNGAEGKLVAPYPAEAGLTLHLEAGQGALFPEADFDVAAWLESGPCRYPLVEYLWIERREGDTLHVKARNTASESNSTLQTIGAGFRVALVVSQRLLDQLDESVPVEYTAEIFVGLHGDDANDGTTKRRAKRHVRAGHDALPLDAVNGRLGRVTVMGGCFDEPSTGRLEASCKWFTESNYVQCNGAKVSDVGAYLRDFGPQKTASGARITAYLEGTLTPTQVGTETKPKWTYVFTPVPGGTKYWQINKTQGYPARTNWSEEPSAVTEALVDKPALEWDPGASMIGSGNNAGKESMDSEGFPTVIRDYDPVAKTSGTGTLMQGYVGEGEKIGSGMIGGVIEAISFLCNPKENTTVGGVHKGKWEGGANYAGIIVGASWGLKLEQVTIKGMGCVGVKLDNKAVVGFSWGTVRIRWCGTESAKYGASATMETGGLRGEKSPNSGTVIELRCVENWGKGMYIGGISIQACESSHTRATAYTGTASTGSGVGLDVCTGKTQGTTDIEHGWFEGNDNYQILGPSSEGLLSIDGMMMSGNRQQTGTTKVGIKCNNGTVRIGLLEAQKHSEATIEEGGSEASPGVISWAPGCLCMGDPKWLKGLKASRDLPASAAIAGGRLNAGVITRTPAPSLVTLVSGTPWQNTTGYDVRVVIPLRVKAGAMGTLKLQRGTTSPGSALPGPIKLPAEAEDVREFYVRALDWLTPTAEGNMEIAGQAEAVPA